MDRLRRGENCLRIGCISGFRAPAALPSAPTLFAFLPREEGSQRGRHKSDTLERPTVPIRTTVLVFYPLGAFLDFFWRRDYLSFFSVFFAASLWDQFFSFNLANVFQVKFACRGCIWYLAEIKELLGSKVEKNYFIERFLVSYWTLHSLQQSIVISAGTLFFRDSSRSQNSLAHPRDRKFNLSLIL